MLKDISSQVSIKQKLIACFALVLAISVGTNLYSFNLLRSIGVELSNTADQYVPLSDAVATLAVKSLKQEVLLEKMIRYGEQAQRSRNYRSLYEKEKKAISDLSADITEDLKTSRALLNAVMKYGCKPAITRFSI